MENTDRFSIDEVIGGLYETISFPPGGQPDWEQLARLFWSEGRLIPAPREERPTARVPMTLQQFVDSVATRIDAGPLKLKGFREREIGRRTDQFGNIAHVYSAYVAGFADGDPTEVGRGINSIQLLQENGRWWVVSIIWDDERPDNPMPSEFAQSV
jgi:hypothetical protein